MVAVENLQLSTSPKGAVSWFVEGQQGARVGEKKVCSRSSARSAMVKALRDGRTAIAACYAVELAADTLASHECRADRDGSGAWLWHDPSETVRRRLVELANEMLLSVKL